MSSIEVYAFEYGDGSSFGEFTTQDPKEAEQHARDHKLRVIANNYEWNGSEPVPQWDFTDSDEDGSEDESRAGER